MNHSRLLSFALCGCALALTAGGSQLATSGPHDVARESDVEAFWLPRHVAVIASRGLADRPAPRASSREPRPLRFRKAVRVSHDFVIEPPVAPPVPQAESQAEPWLAVNPEDPDHLLAGWQENRFRDGGARALGFAVSRDGGRTWVEGRVPGLTTLDDGNWRYASDPWPTFGPDGRAYFASLVFDDSGVNAMVVSVSEDGGDTWGAPVEVVHDAIDFHDKQAIAADAMPASPHRGNAYLAWDRNLFSAASGGQRLLVSRTTDGGASWEAPVALREGAVNIGVVPAVGPDGTVHAVWSGAVEGGANLQLYFARSTDGGRSFTGARVFADLLAVGVPGFRTGAILPSFAVDPASGDLYAAWADARFTGDDQAALSVSRNRGRTWSEPVRVSDAGAPAFTVSVAVNAAGHVAVGYYRSSTDPSGALPTSHWVTVSHDGGRTFAAPVRSTRKSFDAAAAAVAGSAVFLGDYVGLAGAGDRFLALLTATWAPSRDGSRRQSDIYIARSR